jgi:hypothetical protein
VPTKLPPVGASYHLIYVPDEDVAEILAVDPAQIVASPPEVGATGELFVIVAVVCAEHPFASVTVKVYSCDAEIVKVGFATDTLDKPVDGDHK